MAGGGNAAPAQFSAASGGFEFTPHLRRGPEGPLGSPFEMLLQIGNIGFNRSYQAEKIHLRKQMDFFSLGFAASGRSAL